MGEPKKKEQQIRIEADKQIAQGIYSNYASVSHTPEEFTLDFVYVQPQPSEPKVATLRSRIITSPAHMKKDIQGTRGQYQPVRETVWRDKRIDPRCCR